MLRSLNKTYRNMKQKPVTVDLDPKAVTCDELFGIIHPATREWKDGETPRRHGQSQGGTWLVRPASERWVHKHPLRCISENTSVSGDSSGKASPWGSLLEQWGEEGGRRVQGRHQCSVSPPASSLQ